MYSAVPNVKINVFRLRNFLFFFAVLLMHWTLLRPTPADVVFLITLYFSLLLNPPINSRFLVFFVLIFLWTISIFISSIHVINVPAVQFQLLAHTFVVLLGITACLTALTWNEDNFHTFLKVYLASCCVTGALGLIGFGANLDVFLWDGRARGLFDEPNVYGGFLLPGVFGSMYMLSRRMGLLFPLAALVLCVSGVVLSFSRANIFALLLFGPVYFAFLNRNNLARASAYFLIGVTIVTIIGAAVFFGVEGFQQKVLDRLTLAKEYDAGHGGRYDRYLSSIPLILDNPLGLGMLEIDKYFPEPIHNLFISSFLNYGWLAGLAWILFTFLTIRVCTQNYRATQNPLVIWLSFALLSQLPSAMLQQVEHWRHLWMFLGVTWGFNARKFGAAATERRAGYPVPAQRVYQ